jgi:tetratricopeptide (TPR) repeat protein
MATACLKSICTPGEAVRGVILEALPREHDRLNAEAEIHYAKGRYREAVDAWKKCLRLAEQMENMFKQGAASANTGSALCALGDFDQGVSWHKKHLAICLEEGDRDGEGKAHSNIGIVSCPLVSSYSAPYVAIY